MSADEPKTMVHLKLVDYSKPDVEVYENSEKDGMDVVFSFPVMWERKIVLPLLLSKEVVEEICESFRENGIPLRAKKEG